MKKASKDELESLYKIICNDDFIGSFNLSERDKTILQMRIVYNHSYSTIGKQFNISDEMARLIYNRTVDKLLNNIKTIDSMVNACIVGDKETAAKQINGNRIIGKDDLNDQLVIPIFSIEKFSSKCKTELKYKSIETLQQLTSFTEKELLTFRGFGKKILEEIKTELARRNLKLHES